MAGLHRKLNYGLLRSMEILSWPSLGSALMHTSKTMLCSCLGGNKDYVLARWKRRIFFFLLFTHYLIWEIWEWNFLTLLFWVLPHRWNLWAFHRRESLPSCPIQKKNHYHIIIVVLYGLLLLYVALISAPQSVVWELGVSVITLQKLDIVAVHTF